MTTGLFGEFVVSEAEISPCGRYRYDLLRVWDETLPRVCWIMLNPSTADATKLDPTLRRCLAFSKEWGFGSMVIVNLFALRATDPRELRKCGDPIGPNNDAAITLNVSKSQKIVCGWGVHGRLQLRDALVQTMLIGLGYELWCLGKSNGGAPKHPLYLAANTPLRRFP